MHAVDASGAWGRGGVFDSVLRVCPAVAKMYMPYSHVTNPVPISHARTHATFSRYSYAKRCMDLRVGDAHLLPARSTAVAPRYVCLIVLQSAVGN